MAGRGLRTRTNSRDPLGHHNSAPGDVYPVKMELDGPEAALPLAGTFGANTTLSLAPAAAPVARAPSRPQPAFLRKTMEMIDTAPPHIACWADDGRSFFILDSQALATTSIPQYFNHRKTSSFIRQLNFYGFRKVKSDELDAQKGARLEFRHDSFVRGRPDLLESIKRRTYASDGPSSAEVDKLRSEVLQLQQSVTEMRQGMARLTELVKARYPGVAAAAEAGKEAQQQAAAQGRASPPHKKRKAHPAAAGASPAALDEFDTCPADDSLPLAPTGSSPLGLHGKWRAETAAKAADEEEDLRELLESLDFSDTDLLGPPMLLSEKSLDALSRPAQAWTDWGPPAYAPVAAAAPAPAPAALDEKSLAGLPEAAMASLVQRLMPHVVAALQGQAQQQQQQQQPMQQQPMSPVSPVSPPTPPQKMPTAEEGTALIASLLPYLSQTAVSAAPQMVAPQMTAPPVVLCP